MRRLGTTGVEVTPLCLGTMNFARSTPSTDACEILHRALDGGINFIDTADVYTNGESEKIVGEALVGRSRDDVILATKCGLPMAEDPNHRGNSRRWIIRSCENSLRRLGTDWIDLYQVHRPDADTDIDDTMSALSDLVHQGKVCYIGSSTFPVAQIVEAQWVAERRGHERFVCEQPPYSILARGIEREVLPTVQRYGLGAIVWSPLAGGWLSGHFRHGRELPVSSRAAPAPDQWDLSLPANQRKLDTADALARLADEAGLSLIHMAIAFTLEHPAVTAAIVGPRTPEQLDQQLGALDVRLTMDVLDEIDRIVPPGTNLSDPDRYRPPWMTRPALRRRSASAWSAPRLHALTTGTSTGSIDC